MVSLKPKYPKVLVCAIGRINKDDSSNNGLLLRNLFMEWPKECVAQIYSSGSNGDRGAFGRYYQIGSRDRWFGNIFYRMKGSQTVSESYEVDSVPNTNNICQQMLISSGAYEHIFRPRISPEMKMWIEDYAPDCILCQGYNLYFTWLPTMLKLKMGIPLVYYPTDDWSNDLYKPNQARCKPVVLCNQIMRKSVINASNQLVDASDELIAFNSYMAHKMNERYSRKFHIIAHGDDWSRYVKHDIKRCLDKTHMVTIVSIGVFDKHRLPLINDLEEACASLNDTGYHVCVDVYPVGDERGLKTYLRNCRYIKVKSLPGHIDLPNLLCGAGILLLLERFDESSVDIDTSISSKAHLYMYAQKPTIVYSSPVTGVARYAREFGWALTVEVRSLNALAGAISALIESPAICRSITGSAKKTADSNHSIAANHQKFKDIVSAISAKE